MVFLQLSLNKFLQISISLLLFHELTSTKWRKKLLENMESLKVNEQMSENVEIPELNEPSQCTREELLKVRQQLHPGECLSARISPWEQRCSITQATRCVDPTWLDRYYKELRNEEVNLPPFLALSVGCNKGFDALDTLRMGTFDAGLNKTAWRQSMESDGALHASVCEQDTTPQFALPDETGGGLRKKRRTGEIHCFEPMPQTFQRLKRTAESLGYDKKGYKVVHAAVSKESGKMSWVSGNHKAGVENIGLGNKCKSEQCTEVDVLTLQEYVANHIDADGQTRIIHNLSIDVEGFDGDVLLGAGKDLLERVEYLEFEYNWMGSWKNQHLHDFITMLGGKDNKRDNEDAEGLPFTCYWGGMGRLWRITNCWMRYYDIHTWSNVVCVNRKLVPRLATIMEAVFQTTILEERGPYRKNLSEHTDDVMMIVDPLEALISAEYLPIKA